MKLEQVVPWGRSMAEYIDMFALTPGELGSRILGVGDGPASFNAEMQAAERRIVSCDPIYVFSGSQIRSRVEATHDQLVQAASDHRETFVWERIRSPQEMGQIRLAAMERFLADFDEGKRTGRYVAASLPRLPFGDGSFDLAVCSHLLFLYSEQLSLAFHVKAMLEMVRVAGEVRVFPLLMLGSLPSPHLAPLREALTARGCRVEVRRVQYEFQKGGNEMLIVRRG